MTEFQKLVYNLVRTINAGQTMTYLEVAKAIGRPQSARAVGNALNKNNNPEVPCHRVIRSDGSAGGYNRGTQIKKMLLKKEGAIK